MTSYALQPSRFTNGTDLQAAIGTQYHLGISDGTNFYGYLLKPDASQNGGFRQRSDTASKSALTQYSSPNLIDRDLAFFPRVTDGDFSGGGYQEVWIDPRKYFDSDLDPRVPGFLQLRVQWARKTQGGITAGTNFQVVPWKGDFWYTFGEANGNVYSANGASTTSPAGVAVVAIDTDGSYLYAGTGAQLYRTLDGTSWTQVTAAINGTATQWWVVNQGTNGYFAYYLSGPNLLYKIDLTLAFTIAAALQPQVGVGANAINIVDVVEYQTSIAILTTDVQGPGFDVWYFDGNNLTRIIRVEGYTARGISNALGGLYVSAYAVGQKTSPILAHIDSGVYEIVARPGSPFPVSNQSCLQPRASSQYVYWPVITPSINGISSANGLIVQYDVLTGAVTHLPNQDATDYATAGGSLRTVAALGDNLAICYLNGTTGTLQYQKPAFDSPIVYQSSGWLASSHIDFTTPGIAKRFRRVEAHHAPLAAGEKVLVEAFVDRDPITFSTALAPVPATATLENSTAGTTVTSLTFGADTIGKTMFYGLKLTAGTSQLTTPRVNYVSIEIGGTWTWLVTFACTSKRTLLDGNVEESQPSGKDLAYLLLLAYENGANLTLYHRNGQSYTVCIESLDLWTPSPKIASTPQDMKDEEYEVTAILRQVT